MALPGTPGQRISDLCNGNHITQIEGNLVVTYNKISFTIIYGAARHEYDI